MVSRAGAFTVRTFCFLTSSAKVTYAGLRKSVQFGKIELYAVVVDSTTDFPLNEGRRIKIVENCIGCV